MAGQEQQPDQSAADAEKAAEAAFEAALAEGSKNQEQVQAAPSAPPVTAAAAATIIENKKKPAELPPEAQAFEKAVVGEALKKPEPQPEKVEPPKVKIKLDFLKNIDLITPLKKVPKITKESFIESKIGLKSEDGPTRRMSYLYFASLIGLAVTLSVAGKIKWDKKQEIKKLEIEAARVAEEKRVIEAEEKKRRRPPTYQTIGTFSLELREKPGSVKTRGALNNAEMEIFLACDEPELCEWVKHNIDLVRGEMMPLFVPTDREQLLSLSGKKAFREEIRDQINRFLEKRGQEGQVVEVLFPRFILSQ